MPRFGDDLKHHLAPEEHALLPVLIAEAFATFVMGLGVRLRGDSPSPRPFEGLYRSRNSPSGGRPTCLGEFLNTLAVMDEHAQGEYSDVTRRLRQCWAGMIKQASPSGSSPIDDKRLDAFVHDVERGKVWTGREAPVAREVL